MLPRNGNDEHNNRDMHNVIQMTLCTLPPSPYPTPPSVFLYSGIVQNITFSEVLLLLLFAILHTVVSLR